VIFRVKKSRDFHREIFTNKENHVCVHFFICVKQTFRYFLESDHFPEISKKKVSHIIQFVCTFLLSGRRDLDLIREKLSGIDELSEGSLFLIHEFLQVLTNIKKLDLILLQGPRLVSNATISLKIVTGMSSIFLIVSLP